jgi:hypothetical protein
VDGTLSLDLVAEALGALLGNEGVLIADDWLSIDKATEVARVSRSQLYHWMRHEGLPFFDDGDRQIRRSVLLQFKRDKEVVMVRGKKVPAQRAALKSPDEGRGQQQKAPVRKAQKPTSATARAGRGTDKEALLSLLDSSRKAA